MFFGANVILVAICLIGGVIEIARGSWAIGLLMIVAIVPLGIYFRVIMMRRCRDIGWPAFLPWLSFGLQFVASFSASHNLQSLRYGGTPSPSLLSLPLFMALADFVFAIAIGCIRSKDSFDYIGSGEDERYQPSRPGPSTPSVRVVQSSFASAGGPGSDDDDRYDAAIARALEAHRSGPPPLPPRLSAPRLRLLPVRRGVSGGEWSDQPSAASRFSS